MGSWVDGLRMTRVWQSGYAGVLHATGRAEMVWGRRGVLVPKGEDGDADADGEEVLEQPPVQPLVLPLPEWLQKALAKDSAVCRKAAATPWSAQNLEQVCGANQPILSNPTKGHYTLRWVMRQFSWCLIRKNGEGKGEWRKDPTKGGTGHWQPIRGGPMCPLGERVSWGALGALNLLIPPRGVRFVTGHYLLCLPHWVGLGRWQQWRHGKSVQFAPACPALLALPIPHYDPGAKHAYEGLVPGSRTTRGVAAVTRTAPPAASANTAAAAAVNPLEAPTAASNFRLAMGVLHAQGCAEFHNICVHVRVLARV